MAKRLTHVGWILVAVAIGLVVAAGTSLAQSDTSVEIVESRNNAGQFVQIDQDPNGNPVLGYFAEGFAGTRDGFRVARCADDDCSSAITSFVVPYFTRSSPDGRAISLDADGNLVAVYERTLTFTERNLVLVRCNDAACTEVSEFVIDSRGGDNRIAAQSVKMTIDRSGFPVIAFVSQGDGNLRLLRCENAECSSSTTERIKGQASRPALALDRDGNPRLSFVDHATGNLTIARCLDASCSTKTFAAVADASDASTVLGGGGSSVVVGDDNAAVVAFTLPDFNDLQLVVCADAACSSSMVRSVGGAFGVVPDVALDTSGNPVVSFQGGDGDLRLARCVDRECTSWSNEQIDAAGIVGRFSSITFDDSDNPIVGYYDATGLDLKLAHCGNPTCLTLGRKYETPERGRYLLQSVRTGRYLDADPTGITGTSQIPKLDDQWDVIPVTDPRARPGSHELRNALYASDATMGRWTFEPFGDGSVYLRQVRDGQRYLSTAETEVTRDFRYLSDRWVFVEVEPVSLVGQRIALRNGVTGRWLDADGDGAVNQSLAQKADDIWTVEDAGDSTVFLRNEVTGRYLDADPNNATNVDTSSEPRNDDRWALTQQDGFVTLTSAVVDGLVTGLDMANGYDVVLDAELSPASRWRLTGLGPVVTE